MCEENAINPIIVTPETKQIGIDNLNKIVRKKMIKKWIRKINKFLNSHPEFEERLKNHDNYKELLKIFPEIENQIKNKNGRN